LRRWIGKEFNFSVANLHEELRLRFGNQFQQSLIFNLREKVALLQRDGVADGRGELTPAYIPCHVSVGTTADLRSLFRVTGKPSAILWERFLSFWEDGLSVAAQFLKVWI